MKHLAILYIQAIIIFVGVHVTPAAVATVITFKLDTYMVWMTSPLYHAVMFFMSLILTVCAIEYLKEQEI